MLNISKQNTYLQALAIQKKKSNVQHEKPKATSGLTQSRISVPKTSGSNIKALDAMAYSNILNNKSLSNAVKQPMVENIQSKMKQSSDIASNAMSKKQMTASKLELTKQILDSGQLSDDEQYVYELIGRALQAELNAFEDLIDKAKNSAKNSYLAAMGIGKVVKESDKSPALLEMLSNSNVSESMEAKTKLLQMSSSSADAVKKMGRLIQGNKINLNKVANQSKKENPEKTAGGLDSLYRNVNLSKEDKLTLTQVLTNIAVENTLNGAGSKAASALENIFKKDSGAVAKNAAIGLRFAAIAGNEQATDSLVNVATSNVAGKSKNIEAVEQLTKVAKSSGGQSGKATNFLNKAAQSENFSGKMKEKLINSISEIAMVGGANGKKSLETLSKIAGDDKNPHQELAMNNLTKQKSDNVLNNQESVKAFRSISESKRASSKVKKMAFGKLKESVQFGSINNQDKSLNTMANIFKKSQRLNSNQGQNPFDRKVSGVFA